MKWRVRRMLGLERRPEPKEEQLRGSFTMETEWFRSEELRPDRLGPTQDDVENPERVRVERWRPSRTLGPLG